MCLRDFNGFPNLEDVVMECDSCDQLNRMALSLSMVAINYQIPVGMATGGFGGFGQHKTIPFGKKLAQAHPKPVTS